MNETTLLKRALKLAAPPDRMPLSEWADRHRVLSSEGSAAAGPWRTLPFQREVLDAIGPGSEWQTVVLVMAAQLGKSESWLNAVAHLIACDPGPALIVLPTLPMCEAFSKDRLSPLFRDTPILKGKVADPKSREAGSTIYHRRFTGGHLTLVGSNSAAGLASRPIRYLFVDELDRFEESAGAEGDPLSLALARTRTFWNRKIVIASSPTVRGASRIESVWLQSDQREYEVPCPLCGHYQTLEWDRIEWPDGEPQKASYRCVACGEAISHQSKPEMVERGRWTAQAHSKTTAGFRLSELVSPWRSWGELAADWERVQDSPEERRVFINTSLAQWTEEESEPVPEAETLASRCEAYGSEAPLPVALVTAGADVQHDRVECEVTGWAKGYESFSLGYFTFYGDPSQPHVWAQLDTLLKREFRHESGLPLRITAACIDAGYLTDEVLQFTRDKFARKVYAVKGLNSGWSKPIWPRKPIYTRGKVPMFLISVDEAKQWFYRRLAVAEGPGRCHFPAGTPLDYFRMLTAESLVRRTRSGRSVYEWCNVRRERNESLDCRAYAIAALFSLLMSGMNLDKYADDFASMYKPPEVLPHGGVKPEQQPPPQGPVVHRSKFMNSGILGGQW